MERTYGAPRTECEGGTETIIGALGRLPGVLTTHVTIPSRKVRVEFDPGRLPEDRVNQTLIEAGFPPA
jgi:copper chaperone CopZ